ncbi:hypothetical protein DF219_00225 [Corynebacterium liangguodongii]|nr:hypothetical protein DF219_00225 [Corynebacterium liangguodongii]
MRPEDARGGLLGAAADEVDRELVGLSPERDATVNPARALREFAAAGPLVHTGVNSCGRVVARAVAEMWSVRGMASGFVDRDELGRALRETGPEDIFHDPFIDPPAGAVGPAVVAWNQDDRRHLPAGRARAEGVAEGETGAFGAAARLLVRALAATVMENA